MCDQTVVRQNAGQLRGQKFTVNEALIESVKKLSPVWEEKNDRKII